MGKGEQKVNNSYSCGFTKEGDELSERKSRTDLNHPLTYNSSCLVQSLKRNISRDHAIHHLSPAARVPGLNAYLASDFPLTERPEERPVLELHFTSRVRIFS